VDSLTRRLLDARDGDRAALGEFVRESQADVWRFCARVVDRDTADDLTQKTYLNAILALPRYRGDASARTWLFAIARHTCFSHLRRRIRRRAIAHQLDARTVTDSRPADAVDIEILIGDLDDDRRVAFILTQIVGMTYEETAVICDCPVGTIRSRVARARHDLIAGLEPSDREHPSAQTRAQSRRRFPGDT
jgi:RNA polymerase sigma-70 factor, ECF subfamily